MAKSHFSLHSQASLLLEGVHLTHYQSGWLAGSMRAMQVFPTVQHCSPYHNVLVYPARHDELTQGCPFLQHVLQQHYHLALTLHLSFRNLRMLFSSIIILTFLSSCKEIIHISPKKCKSQNGNGENTLQLLHSLDLIDYSSTYLTAKKN